jgi:hypothetical protein
MDNDEVLDKLKSVINALIKDNPEDPKNAEEGHMAKATAELHDVITTKMRDRVVGTQPADTEPPEEDPNAELAPPVPAPAAAPAQATA